MKFLPNSSTSTLGESEVNTAFTLQCAPNGEMVIFRSEEWFKVFIHETFHTYGLDFNTNDSPLAKERVKALFPIDSDYNIEEAYAETWARILNCAVSSYDSLNDKKDTKTYLLYMDFSLKIERLFSLYQCDKVLRFMGLTYKDLCGDGERSAYLRKNFYREKTNVFAYYILTAIFMNDYGGFLKWCATNNIAFMRFNNTHRNFDKFADFIEKEHNTKSLHDGLDSVKKIGRRRKSSGVEGLINTTRMSIIEIN
jgi:hypothetical protein